MKRILADVRELEKHQSSRYAASPLEDNMFEWHFTIRGPNGTDFEGGIYHGRILLPPEYPFKPPNIIFLNKNGRFEVGTKICLSISAYHEESWQPAWGVRTMLEAIISFLPSEGAGAIGSLDWTKEERKKLAIESHNYCCPLCGNIASLLSDPSLDENNQQDPEIASQISQLSLHAPQSATVNSTPEKVTKLKECDEIIDEVENTVTGKNSSFEENKYFDTIESEGDTLQLSVDSLKLTRIHMEHTHHLPKSPVEEMSDMIELTATTTETINNLGDDQSNDNQLQNDILRNNNTNTNYASIISIIEDILLVFAIIIIIFVIIVIFLRKLKRISGSIHFYKSEL